MKLCFPGRRGGKTLRRDLWDELGHRTHLSPTYARTVAYVLLYKGSVDPWLDRIVGDAIAAILRERQS